MSLFISRMFPYDLFVHESPACSDPLLEGIPSNLMIIPYCHQRAPRANLLAVQ